jgi:hypothetical protein
VSIRKGFPNGDTAQVSTAFEESVRRQLGRILRSSAFANAPSLSRFLRYLVERTLQGNGSPLNEYTLGVDVFDRGESFDPRVDNIVRVQVRRLRSKLEKYYAYEGRVDPLVVEVPRGRYEAVFRAASAEDDGVRASRVEFTCCRSPLSSTQERLSRRLLRVLGFGIRVVCPCPGPCSAMYDRRYRRQHYWCWTISSR